ncbi:MAG: tetratricopeptide repeat protein, partial [Gemmatimonadales bacterium]
FFVMEYVEGQPITEYCTARVSGLRDRIRLMQAVCAAVQHAHQNFVVHRDLKPRNIFVTADGTPKLLDFGIGKVLADDRLGPAVSTRAEARLLTPEYATPEQLDGGLVTTATDVYGLGLLLYEVLAGRHPYLAGGESLAEIERAVLTAEPRAPSVASGRRELAGDLDTIVLKALRKEPERRYVSAAELADDLQRHLDGLPVRARPDTIGYRARKFVTRNAWPVAAGTVAFLGLAATSAVTIVQSRRVAAEAARATRERDQALEVRGFLLEMFGATGANQAVGDTITAKGLLDLQARQVDEAYRYRPALRADMLEVLADGYDRLGIYQPAESLARLALDQRRYVDPDGPAVAATLNLLGWIVHERGRSAEAEPLVLEAVARRRADLPHSEQELSRSLNDLGVIYNATNRYAAAESVLVEALEIRRRRQGDSHRVVGITANNLAASYYFQRKLDAAIATQQLALESLRQSVGEDHQRTIVALGNLAAFRLASGDLAGAEREYRDLLERQTRLQGPDHPVTARVRLSLGSAISDRAAFTHSDSAFDSAEDLLRSAVRSFEKTLGPEHLQVATAMGRLATVRIARGEWDDAVRILERAVAIVRRQPTGNDQLLKQAEARLAAVRQSRDSVVQAKAGG